jgi:hypothetical protein
MKLVHRQLVAHPQVDQQHTRQSCGKTNEIDEEHALKAFEVPEDEKKVMSDHDLKC